MNDAWIYLDANATTPMRPEVWEAMRPYALEKYGNASSSHSPGRRSRQALEDSREEIASFLGAFPDEVYFTSGATEANNLAIHCGAGNGDILLSRLEHASVITPVEALARAGRIVHWQTVLPTGIIDLDTLNIPDTTSLACLMLVNHETGMIQPVETLGRRFSQRGWLHCDAVQAAGKMRIDFHRLCVQSLSISAHKFHGPKGVGALLVRRGSVLKPMLQGGGQERSLRPGTEPIHSIVGMACALRLAQTDLDSNRRKLLALRDLFLNFIRGQLPSVVVNGALEQSSPHALNLAFPGLRSDLLLMKLDMEGVACSTGSACSSGSLLPSPVLQAMDVVPGILSSSMRFSFHVLLSEAEVLEGAGRVTRAVKKMAVS